MKDEKKIRGMWWIHGSEKEAMKGALNTETLELTIWIHREQSNSGVLMSSLRESEVEISRIIVGTDHHNNRVSLFGCWLSNHSSSSGAQSWSINALFVLHGLEVLSWDQPFIRSICIKPNSLHRWFEKDLLTAVKAADGQSAYVPSQELNLEYSIDEDTSVRFYSSLLSSYGFDEIRWRHDSQIWIHVKSAQSLKELSDKWIPWTSRLLSILVGGPVRADQILVHTDNPFVPDSIKPNSEARVIRAKQEESSTQHMSRLLPQEFLVRFNEIENGLEELLCCWNQLCDTHGPAIDLFCAVAFQNSLTTRARFLSLVQALEVYHTCSKRYNSTSTPIAVQRSNLEEAKSQLNPRLWEWAKGKLSFNARTLGQKLEDLFRSHEPECIHLLGDLNREVSRIVFTRNHFTHHTEGNIERLISDSELVRISIALELVVWTIIFSELSVGKKSIDRLLKRYDGLNVINLDG